MGDRSPKDKAKQKKQHQQAEEAKKVIALNRAKEKIKKEDERAEVPYHQDKKAS